MSEPMFGEAIRLAREAKKMTLRALAEAVGVSAPFQSDLERGRRWPGPELMDVYSRVLDIPLEDLNAMRGRDKVGGAFADLVRLIVREELKKQPPHVCPGCRVIR